LYKKKLNKKFFETSFFLLAGFGINHPTLRQALYDHLTLIAHFLAAQAEDSSFAISEKGDKRFDYSFSI
jgi:hypothetical protein